MSEEEKQVFEVWLRKNCFQKPTKEAYNLAQAAWLAGKWWYIDQSK